MPVNRELFSMPITDDSCPPWPCPTCGIGTLSMRKKSDLRSFETAMSETAHQEEWFEPEMSQYRFSAVCTCTNHGCREQVIACGDGEVFISYTGDAYGRPIQEYHIEYKIKHIHPPPKLLPLTDDIPASVAEQIDRASSLFWTDTAACVGAIRTSIEAALTEKGIPRFQYTKAPKKKPGRRTVRSLHSRIQLLETSGADAASLLMAAKWIGNSGAHTGEIGNVDIFDALDIADEAFRLLFSSASDRIRKLAKQVNKKKGPRKN